MYASSSCLFRCGLIVLVPALLVQSSPAVASSEAAGLPALQVRVIDGSTELLLVGHAPFHATSEPVLNARLVEVPNASVLAALWDQQRTDGTVVPYYAISLDGRRMATVREADYRVQLWHGEFDPLIGVPAVEANLEAAGDVNLYLVQFITQSLEEYRSGVEALGGTIYTYVAQYAHVVHMGPRTAAQVAALPYVRWVGPYHPAYRLEEFVRLNLDQGEALRPDHRYHILVGERGMAQRQTVAARVEALGGVVFEWEWQGLTMDATVTPEQLLEIVRMDEVLFIDRWGPPGEDMDVARQISGANYLELVEGFNGQGVRGEVLDTGLRTTHVDFQGPPPLIHFANGSSTSHGTNVYGIVFGTGTANVTGRGVLPGREQGIFMASSSVVFPHNATRYTRTAELVNPAGPYRAVFQTNSTGDAQVTTYTNVSADMDDIILINDLLICQSQSNTSNQNSRPQAWAKNIMATGGINHNNTLSRSDDSWTTASIGPASDGRIKPELAHFYDNIFTTSSSCDTCYTSSFGGTSGATPINCAHHGLIYQMWHEGVWPGHGDGGTVFDSRCHSTTARALAINTAFQYAFTSPTANLSRYKQGWGMVDLRALYDIRDKTFIIDETDVLTNLSSMTYQLSVEPGEPAFKATLVYIDPRGNPAVQTQHRINDLTLKVTSPGGTVYWGNNGMTSGVWTVPGGTANTKDTVENVFVQNPQAGTWIVEVQANEVIQDTHSETTEIDVDYALVVTGVQTAGGPCGDFDGDGDVDLADFTNFQLCFGGSNNPPAPTCPAGVNADCDGDGDVDLADFIIFQQNFTGSL